MKTMKNFATQQLTKKQMNEVVGGAYKMNCTIISGKSDELIDLGVLQTENHFADQEYLQAQFPNDTVECIPWLI